MIAEGITEHRITDHGNAWALYFKDPEDNPGKGIQAKLDARP